MRVSKFRPQKPQRAQPPFSGNQFKRAGDLAHDERLNEPRLRDGRGQLAQSFLVELAAGLIWIGLDAVDGQHHQLPPLKRRLLPRRVGFA